MKWVKAWWGESKTEREREQEIMDKEWEAECGWKRVEALVINFIVGQVFMRA
jgi:hypothetical protein